MFLRLLTFGSFSSIYLLLQIFIKHSILKQLLKYIMETNYGYTLMAVMILHMAQIL